MPSALLDRRQRGGDDLDVEDRHEHAEAHDGEARQCAEAGGWFGGLQGRDPILRQRASCAFRWHLSVPAVPARQYGKLRGVLERTRSGLERLFDWPGTHCWSHIEPHHAASPSACTAPPEKSHPSRATSDPMCDRATSRAALHFGRSPPESPTRQSQESHSMEKISRRDILALGAVGGAALATNARAASFGNPDQPAEGAINANPAGLSDPGPKNEVLYDQFPSRVSPPATDVGGMPQFWASFNTAAKRIQNGGWARQVTQDDFAISDADFRRQHAPWPRRHPRDALASGRRVGDHDQRPVPRHGARPAGPRLRRRTSARATSGISRPAIRTRCRDWVPTAANSSSCFDDGKQSEYNTLLLTDWMAHTPPEILALNFGVPADTFTIDPASRSVDFPGQGAGSAVRATRRRSPRPGCRRNPFTFRLASRPRSRATARARFGLPTARTSRCRRRSPPRW